MIEMRWARWLAAAVMVGGLYAVLLMAAGLAAADTESSSKTTSRASSTESASTGSAPSSASKKTDRRANPAAPPRSVARDGSRADHRSSRVRSADADRSRDADTAEKAEPESVEVRTVSHRTERVRSTRTAAPTAAAAARDDAEPAPTALVTERQLTTGAAVQQPANWSPLDAISTAITNTLYNVVAFAGQALIPQPVIPAGSSVTVGRAPLDLGCDCGQTVNARWYFPNQEQDPAGIIYLQHGFFRNDRAVSALAVQLAERTNSVVVAPTLSSNPFAPGGWWINGAPMPQAVAGLFDDRTALTASAVAAGWDSSTPLPETFILAGHSAGGGLAAAAAGHAKNNENLAGVIMFDGVSSGDRVARALADLEGSGVQVLQIAAPPSAWNNSGSTTDALVAARPGEFAGVRLVGGTHIDAEGASSDLFAHLLVGVPRPANVQAVQVLATDWILTMYAGGTVEDVPGTVIRIGDATAVVLPAAAAQAQRIGPSEEASVNQIATSNTV